MIFDAQPFGSTVAMDYNLLLTRIFDFGDVHESILLKGSARVVIRKRIVALRRRLIFWMNSPNLGTDLCRDANDDLLSTL